MKIDKDHIEKLYKKQHGSFSSNDFEITIDSYHDCGYITSISLRSNRNEFVFFCNSKKLTIYLYNEEGLIIEQHRASFDDWRSINRDLENPLVSSSFDSRDQLINGLGFGNLYFTIILFKFLENVFWLIESESNNLKEGVNLIPLDDAQTSNYQKQDWYQKLLTEYTEYYQSDSKSDIVDRHYQEQAHLHGLKFVVR